MTYCSTHRCTYVLLLCVIVVALECQLDLAFCLMVVHSKRGLLRTFVETPNRPKPASVTDDACVQKPCPWVLDTSFNIIQFSRVFTYPT